MRIYRCIYKISIKSYFLSCVDIFWQLEYFHMQKIYSTLYGISSLFYFSKQFSQSLVMALKIITHGNKEIHHVVYESLLVHWSMITPWWIVHNENAYTTASHSTPVHVYMHWFLFFLFWKCFIMPALYYIYIYFFSFSWEHFTMLIFRHIKHIFFYEITSCN